MTQGTMNEAKSLTITGTTFDIGGNGINLLSQILSGELNLESGISLSGAVHPVVKAEAKERLILSVRHEQVQTTESTYQFIGSKLLGESISGGQQKSEIGLSTVTDEMKIVEGEGFETPGHMVGAIAGAIEVSIFIIFGAVIALILSPFSPLGRVVPIVSIVIMPIGVIAVLTQAIIRQRRLRFFE